ncbi:MAG: T9SS type A sorting domain-containing protein [Bacteroidales bacterium]|jgi:hypothetical protein|nr:T9SS type A sorting domain-containing protein [Bacteroidales bacterium]MDD3700153.1 T9SS type A sorting domain-containing protein [Bacteroidales bacterium]MDY0370165.1 T9SS type A sorting domain-containing protein [Bacteroidales bacterium]
MNNLFLLVMLFSVTLLHAQAPEIEWQKSLGGTGEDVATSIQQTSDGGYIVAGYSYSNDGDIGNSHGNADYWIVKLDHAGKIQWEKSMGGSSTELAYFVQQTSDGGYIVAGESSSNDGDVSGNHGSEDYWIVKLDDAGNLQWQKSLGGSSTEVAYSIQQTSDGGYIVAGESSSNDGDVTKNHGESDCWIVKLDHIGNIQWEKSLGGSENDWASSIQQTSDGGYIIGGTSRSNDGDVSGNHGDYDYWIAKLDNVGNLQWQKSLGGSFPDYLECIQQTLDSGYIVVGESFSNDGDVSESHRGRGDYWVVKLDNAGNIQWEKALGGSGQDWAYSISQTSDRGFIIAGWAESQDGDVSGNHGAEDYWIVKLDNAGNLHWQRSIGGSSTEVAYSIQQTSDGGYIVAGYSDSHDGDINEYHGNGDFWIIKLTGSVGLNETINNTIFSVYPNPATDLITIKGVSPKTELIFINTNGEIVFQTIAGSYEIPIDISGLPTGMYFINGQKFIKK